MLTVCDYVFHVRPEALYYPSPGSFSIFPGQPTGELYCGFLLVALFCTSSGWLLVREQPSRGLIKGLLSIFLFVLVYFLSGKFQDYPTAMNTSFFALWLGHLLTFRHGVRKILGFSVLLGIAGPLLEGRASEIGFLRYIDVDEYNVPFWLSGLYLNGALAVATTIPVLESWRKKNNS